MDNTPTNQPPIQPLPESITPLQPAATVEPVFASPFGAVGQPEPAPLAPPVTNFASGSGTDIIAKKSPFKNKKLLIVAAAILGAVVVLGIIAFVIINMLSVSKKDYRDAAIQFNKVASASSLLSTALFTLQYDTTGSTTETEFTNDSSAVDKALLTLKDENTKFATLKAVKVGEGKKYFDAFNVKLNNYSTYVKDFTTSMKSVRPAFTTCGNSDSGSDVNARLATCISALANATDVPNVDLKQYVTTLQTQFASLKDLTAQATALTDPYGKQYEQYKVLRDKRYVVQDAVSSASKDFKSNLTKHADDVDPKTSANALSDFLDKQVQSS